MARGAGTPSPLDVLAHEGGRGGWSLTGRTGRIPKTPHLLTFFDDEEHRRFIGRQLTRHESRHSLARTTFHGRRGELRQRYREGQEDQLGALGLVVNILVLSPAAHTARVPLPRSKSVLFGEGIRRRSPDIP
jgi:Tn3 transposase DDE domain